MCFLNIFNTGNPLGVNTQGFVGVKKKKRKIYQISVVIIEQISTPGDGQTQ